MGRPRAPKRRLRPVTEVLEAYTTLFQGMYVGIELPDNAEGHLEALGWVLGLPSSEGAFYATLTQVQEALRAPTPITNAREQPQGEP